MGSVVEPSFYAKVARFLIDGGDEEAAGLLLTCHLDVRWKRVTSQDVYTVDIGAPRSAYDILRQADHPVAQAVQRAFTAFLLPGRVGFNIYPQVEIDHDSASGDWRADVLRSLIQQADDAKGNVRFGTSFMGALAIGNLQRILEPYVSERGMGYVVAGMACVLDQGKDDEWTYTPPLSFIRPYGLTSSDNSRPYPYAPTLVVLVVSPFEREETTMLAVNHFLLNGSQQAWVLYPSLREVHQRFSDIRHHINVYGLGDEVRVEELFPDLVLKATDIFALPDGN